MKRRISSERAVGAFAGFMVLLSVVLTFFVHPLSFPWRPKRKSHGTSCRCDNSWASDT
jgi:hypothetical protein